MFKKSFKEDMMRLAMEEASKAIESGNRPFGAVLVSKTGEVIAKAHNTVNSSSDITAHAEINLLRNVCKELGKLDLSDYVIFCNAESCSMCMTAKIKAKIDFVYYGAPMGEYANPYIPPSEVASKSKNPIKIEVGILKSECIKQINGNPNRN